MPSLNEETNIERAVANVVHSFERLGTGGEIIVVNDGSTDGTDDVISALQKKYSNLRTLKHERPMGIGKSFWDGVRTAQGECVTMLPGDGENDAYEILRYLPLMEHTDLVIPFVFNRATRSLARRIVSFLYRAIVNLSFGTTLNYMNGTVIYRRCILNEIELSSTGFFYQAELLMRCIRRGYLYAEVPYGLFQREGGKSKAISLKSLRRVMGDYLTTLKAVYSKDEASRTLSPGSISARRRAEFLKENESGTA
ncbi:MAG: glycosyltransferase family 2 protein [Deltaproteobacteria bacterium]|nr:glycosyltransferase family 2 protein [Deltaproteobacteria bacterium]